MFAPSDIPKMKGTERDETKKWIDSLYTIKDSMVDKYGDYNDNISTSISDEYIWNIVYDDCLVGVDISVKLGGDNYTRSDYTEEYGTLYYNSITYTPHNYQADIDAYNDKQNLIKETSDSL